MSISSSSRRSLLWTFRMLHPFYVFGAVWTNSDATGRGKMLYNLSYLTICFSSPDGSKAAHQKARSEQQESAQSSNKRARIEFASSTTSAPQRVSGTRSDANNPYLQHHSRAVPTAPPRKSRFGAQYGTGSTEQIKSGRQPWG